jgi:hypothetical protein
MKFTESASLRSWAQHGWRLYSLLLVALLAVGMPARGDLKWEATRLELHPPATAKEAKGEFLFTNEGSKPVTIDSVESGCGCTTAVLEKLTYQPGETGRIQVTFHIGDRTGFQDKVIRVKVHGVKDPIVLSLATHVPEMLRIEPRFVFWRTGDPPEPRMIKLTATPESRLGHLHVISTNPKFKAEIQTLREGSDYRLVVTPEDTAVAGTSSVLAILALPEPAMPNSAPMPKRFQVFANIVPK